MGIKKINGADAMWLMFMKFGQKANIASLKDYVDQLIRMTTQKTAGQRGNGDISFDDLETIKWGVIIEATALVLSGKLDGLEEDDD